MPHFQKTTEEMASFHTVPVYLVMELVFHARMLDVSAALLTFKKSKDQCRVSNSSHQITKSVHVLDRIDIMPCEELFS